MIKLSFVTLMAAAVLSAVPAAAVTVIGATRVVITNGLPNWLQVAEVQAFDFSATNVALTGLASASSVYQNGPATPDKANDGSTNGIYPNIFHSGSPNAGEFLQIDFAAPATLSSLTVFGRTDCCNERDLFNVSIYNSNNTLLYSGVLDSRGALSASVSFDAPINGVPEAATWAMLIAGFGLTGAALRRRRLVAA